MANYKLVDSDKLDADMTSVADKLREKSETTDKLLWPSGFIDAAEQCSSLNFSVVGGTTKPENPKENTIWVNTATDISRWVISAKEPEKLTESMVWISTGTSSKFAFNALKKNEISIYPLTIKQYVNSGWVEKKEAQIYQGAAWNDVAAELNIYNSGAFGVDPDGTTLSIKALYDNTENSSIINKQDSFMVWTCGDGRKALFYIEPKISCSGYNTLNISISTVSNPSGGTYNFGLAAAANSTTPNFTAQKTVDMSSGTQKISLDISNIDSTKYYAAMQVIKNSDSGDFSCNVTRIWLE